MQYWLMKSEPGEFSIEDLQQRTNQIEPWDGVRNYQARNFMRQMKCEDQVFFYHSNCTPPGIVGIAEICRTAYPDPTQFDPDNSHYDPKSPAENPRWDLVDLKFVRQFKEKITLADLREMTELADFALVRKGNRLSVMPVTEFQWQSIMNQAKL